MFTFSSAKQKTNRAILWCYVRRNKIKYINVKEFYINNLFKNEVYSQRGVNTYFRKSFFILSIPKVGFKYTILGKFQYYVNIDTIY